MVKIVRDVKKSNKEFVKKHHADPRRKVIDLVVIGNSTETADNNEWAAMEREKMEEKMLQDAFERGGKKPAAKKRIYRNTKKK